MKEAKQKEKKNFVVVYFNDDIQFSCCVGVYRKGITAIGAAYNFVLEMMENTGYTDPKIELPKKANDENDRYIIEFSYKDKHDKLHSDYFLVYYMGDINSTEKVYRKIGFRVNKDNNQVE